MRGKKKFIVVLRKFDRRMVCNFSAVSKFNIIGETKFAQSHEDEKTSEKHGEEQEIIMVLRVGKVIQNY
jgi:hypothetical protein